MRFLHTAHSLRKEMSRMLKEYDEFNWAIAWASSTAPHWKELLARRTCISRAVIGTHFYQTHPDVLDAFLGFSSVRFILQPSGVFHPKLYFFSKGDAWEALIGSPNFTSPAFESNSEAAILVNSADSVSQTTRERIFKAIGSYWDEAQVVTPRLAADYRRLWQLQQGKLRRLSGTYGSSLSRTSPITTSLFSMTFEEFFARIQAAPHHSLDGRLELLSVVQRLFREHDTFADIPRHGRAGIAGIIGKEDVDWGWFGSMKGAGVFKNRILENAPSISSALSKIPIDGAVEKEHYLGYVGDFLRAFPEGRVGVATATRLLAMKRPDSFVCLDSKNKRALCRGFGIKQSSMTYERYWDEIVDRLMDSVWWRSKRPTEAVIGKAWDGRAALLDALFYDPSS